LPTFSLVLLIPVATISGCRHLKLSLKANIHMYVNSTTKRCPNKIIKIFLIEDFFHLPWVSLTPVVHLEPRMSPRMFKKIRNGRIGTLRCWGKLIHEKNQESKISWHCPFKSSQIIQYKNLEILPSHQLKVQGMLYKQKYLSDLISTDQYTVPRRISL
jgi:hypothetical protein